MNPTDVQRCFVINLDRSTARLAAFRRRVAAIADWPFPPVERFAAIDEEQPAWYKSGRGSWGCLRSHLEVYAKCRREGCGTVLVFEDDAVFCDDFAARCREFLSHVPKDWDQIYLGGHHGGEPDGVWYAPEPINDHVVKARCCNTNHAVIFRGSALLAVDTALVQFPTLLADSNCHIDTLWGTLHDWGTLRAYCPWRFLVGQSAGLSDRNGCTLPEDFYFDVPEGFIALHRNGHPPVKLPDIPGWLTQPEGEALSRLARGRRVLEIGTYFGLSAAVMAQTAESVDTIDTHRGDNDTGPADTLDVARRNLQPLGNVRMLVGEMGEHIPQVRIGQYGLVYYDAQHDYASTRRGIDLMIEAGLRPDTIVAFHDFNWPDVERAVREFAKQQGRTIAVVDSLAVT